MQGSSRFRTRFSADGALAACLAADRAEVWDFTGPPRPQLLSTAHGATQVWATFDESMRSYRGYPSSIITEDFIRPEGVDFAPRDLLLRGEKQIPRFARDDRSRRSHTLQSWKRTYSTGRICPSAGCT